MYAMKQPVTFSVNKETRSSLGYVMILQCMSKEGKWKKWTVIFYCEDWTEVPINSWAKRNACDIFLVLVKYWYLVVGYLNGQVLVVQCASIDGFCQPHLLFDHEELPDPLTVHDVAVSQLLLNTLHILSNIFFWLLSWEERSSFIHQGIYLEHYLSRMYYSTVTLDATCVFGVHNIHFTE